MIALAIDTSSSLCSACIYDSEQQVVLGKMSKDIGRGHAEHLMQIISDTMGQAKVEHANLDRIVACVGPGSFTGIRVGVATARGFGIALKIPVIGVSILESLIDLASDKDLPTGVVQEAGRGEAYCQFTIESEFAAANTPFLINVESLVNSDLLKTPSLVLCGSGAKEVANGLDTEVLDINPHPPIEFIALMGCKVEFDGSRPEPLYLRKPDAKVQEGFAVARTGH